MKIKLFAFIISAILFSSCSKIFPNLQSIGGSQSTIGEVDNTFSFSQVEGVASLTAEITELNDGVSKITYTAKISDSKLLALAQGIDDADVSGSTLTREREYRITDKGIESVYPEGNLILVKYDDKVGDKYSLKRGSKTITREVTSKSTADDYPYGFFDIKTIKVEETGRNIPGVTKIEFIANHRFGMVGIRVYFEDGTTKDITVYSYNEN